MHLNKKTKSFIKSITLTVLIITVAFGFGIDKDRLDCIFTGYSGMLGVFTIIGIIVAATYAIGAISSQKKSDGE